MAVWRIPKCRAETGDSRSKFYSDIAKRLMVRPIKIGDRAVGIPSDEIEQINRARIAGKSPDEIRALVQQLEASRTGLVAP